MGVGDEPKHFEDRHIRFVYVAMRILKYRRLPIDVLSVSQQLSEMDLLVEVGGPGYIARLTSEVSSSKDVGEWAKSLVLNWKERTLQG